MPKSYSENERAQIIKQLKEETKLLLTQYGVKKTSVDEIVKRVKIPKGTFYLFYSSKEKLLFEVISEEQELLQNLLLDEIAQYNGLITREQFSEIIFNLYKNTVGSFVYTLATNGEMELLMRKLPKELVEEHIEQDDLYMSKLFSLLPKLTKTSANTFSGALRGIFLMTIHKREIGETVFYDAIQMLIKGLSDQIFKEEI